MHVLLHAICKILSACFLTYNPIAHPITSAPFHISVTCTYGANNNNNILFVEFTPTPLLGSRCWHPIMWNEPPPPPPPKKKKTKTEIDEEGNEVIIELSEDESSDEEEEVLPTTNYTKTIIKYN